MYVCIYDHARLFSTVGACALAVERGVFSTQELSQRIQDIQQSVENAFNLAVNEPKITDVVTLQASNSQPLAPVTSSVALKRTTPIVGNYGVAAGIGVDNMRKWMTRLYDEILGSYPTAVYLGEDVQHGGVRLLLVN